MHLARASACPGVWHHDPKLDPLLILDERNKYRQIKYRQKKIQKFTLYLTRFCEASP